MALMAHGPIGAHHFLGGRSLGRTRTATTSQGIDVPPCKEADRLRSPALWLLDDAVGQGEHSAFAPHGVGNSCLELADMAGHAVC